jgi:hypothetical protein
MSYEKELARVRARGKPSPRVRLLWTAPNGFDGWVTYDTLTQARAGRHVECPDAIDWVIVELTEPGKYGLCGRVLDSVEE